jgi:predicted acetyltransferase
MYFNGKDTPVAGIAEVGTLPAYRRRGYLRQIVATHFQRMYEDGERSIAILYPSQAAVYRRFGYAMVTTQYTWQIQPRSIQFVNPEPAAGDFRVVTDDELKLLEQIYHGFCRERTGCIHRDRGHWQWNILRLPRQGILGKVVYREDDKPLGYVLYTIESTGPGHPNQRLTIRDFAWLSHTAYQAIWQHLAGLDLIGTITRPDVPPDDFLSYLLLEPRVPSVTETNGLMARLVDVPRALTQRNYPMEGRLTFEVQDELCPWNEGRWVMETSGGETSVRKTDDSPQVVMPVSTLALLTFGRISATEAARMKLLDAPESRALPAWDMVMRTAYQPICTDHF